MKNYICAISLLLISLSLTAQIQFVGDPEEIISLNTEAGENYLVLNPHKRKMAFTKEGRQGLEESEYVERFYETFDSTWLPPRVFTDWSAEEGMFSPIGFDREGNEYFSEVIFRQGKYSGRISRFVNDGGVAHLKIPFFRSKSQHLSGCLSVDGRYMIVSMESNFTYGVEDLYLIERKSKREWKSPINLGGQINSEFQELTPYLAADNRTLFFATNGRGGEGSLDIYYSIRLDDSWRKWSEPVNVGQPVNTPGAETSFSFLDGDEWAYYVSSKDSDGYGDIYRIPISSDIEKDSSATEEPGDESVVGQVILKVVDKKTEMPIWSELIGLGETITSQVGFFVIEELNGQEIELKSLGYLPRIVELSTDELKIGENIITLEPVTVGSTITLSHVLFNRGTAKMIEGSEKELNLVVEMMNDNPTIKILLKGHTDNQGDPVLNLRLSEARVKTVRKYLISQGVNAYRIRSVGYGGNAPIASNATEETRQLNRRVEFEVLEN